MGYRDRVGQRIERVRKRGARAMTLVALVTAAFLAFLVYVLLTAIRLGNAEAVRAAWMGIAIILVVNGLSFILYRSQQKVLDEAVSELTDLLGDESES